MRRIFWWLWFNFETFISNRSLNMCVCVLGVRGWGWGWGWRCFTKWIICFTYVLQEIMSNAYFSTSSIRPILTPIHVQTILDVEGYNNSLTILKPISDLNMSDPHGNGQVNFPPWMIVIPCHWICCVHNTIHCQTSHSVAKNTALISRAEQGQIQAIWKIYQCMYCLGAGQLKKQLDEVMWYYQSV